MSNQAKACYSKIPFVFLNTLERKKDKQINGDHSLTLTDVASSSIHLCLPFQLSQFNTNYIFKSRSVLVY